MLIEEDLELKPNNVCYGFIKLGPRIKQKINEDKNQHTKDIKQNGTIQTEKKLHAASI